MTVHGDSGPRGEIAAETRPPPRAGERTYARDLQLRRTLTTELTGVKGVQ